MCPLLKLTVERWTNEAEQDLKACFDLTDWSCFEAAANDLDELTETVISYISFTEKIFSALKYLRYSQWKCQLSIKFIMCQHNLFSFNFSA